MPSLFSKALNGVSVKHCKNTANSAAVRMPVPDKVVIPMIQHMGAPCEPLVKVKDTVTVGQLLGDTDAFLSAPIHSSVSGTVTAIEEFITPGGDTQRAMAISEEISQRHGVACMPINCLTLNEQDIKDILKAVLFEFPLCEMDFFLPPWVDALDMDHPIKNSIYSHIREAAGDLSHVREVREALTVIDEAEEISASRIAGIDLGKGVARVELDLPRELFYETLSSQSGFTIADDGDLLSLLRSLAEVKRSYDKVSDALQSVHETGYGIVMPSMEELILEEPEIMRQGGRYGVRLKASAPSIHMFKVDIESTVSPIVGNEKQSEDMVNYLMEKFSGDPAQIWESNIFGRSFHELVNEDLQAKLYRMPMDARLKFQETLQRVVNEGSGGLICIIL